MTVAELLIWLVLPMSIIALSLAIGARREILELKKRIEDLKSADAMDSEEDQGKTEVS